METKVLDIKGKEKGTCALPESLFAVKANPTFLHEVVTAFLANQRSKSFLLVSGFGSRDARQGSLRAPQFRHGGVAFGPTPHSYRQELPVAKRRLALAMALSTKLSEGNLVVLEDLKVSEPKTKAFAAVLETLSAGRKPLLLGNFADANTKLAGRNIAGLTHLLPEDINAYVVLNSTKVIMTKEALEKISATFTKEAK